MKKLIVIIEDSPVMRRVARETVGGTRSGVFIPDTIEQIDAIDAEDVALLIQDVVMPDEWIAALKRLKGRLRDAGIAPMEATWTAAAGHSASLAETDVPPTRILKTATADRLYGFITRFLQGRGMVTA